MQGSWVYSFITRRTQTEIIVSGETAQESVMGERVQNNSAQTLQ